MFSLYMEGVSGYHGPMQVCNLLHQVRKVRDLVCFLSDGFLRRSPSSWCGPAWP